MIAQSNNNQTNKINLSDIVNALFNYKLLIAIITLLGFFISVAIALFSTEWWSSNAQITKPQYHNYSMFSQYTNSLQSIDDKNQSILKIADPEENYKQFIALLSSKTNKINFIKETKQFQDYLNLKNITKNDAITSSLDEFTKKIVITKTSLVLNSDSYQISAQALTKSDSIYLLTEYINFTQKEFNILLKNSLDDYRRNLTAFLIEKRNQNNSFANREIRKRKLETEIAIDIAKTANISKPLNNYNAEKDYFNVNLGYTALEAQKNALNKDDVNIIFNDELAIIESKLDSLNAIPDIDFSNSAFFSYIETPMVNSARTSPNRKLIVITITFCFLLFSFVIALGLNFFRSRQ